MGEKVLAIYSDIVNYNSNSPVRTAKQARIEKSRLEIMIMKRFRLVLTFAALNFALFAFSAHVFAQSDAQKSFDALKTLAGHWTGPYTLDPPDKDMSSDKPLHVTLRVTSRGNAIVHEIKDPGTPDDPKHDDPVTLIYLENERLNLVHYCDAGNRPHMIARPSEDGKTVEFDFVDLSGGNQFGHMYHAVFKVIDANHHTEDWTFMMPGDKPMHAHMDLQRVN
jgi:hypothetical protein